MAVVSHDQQVGAPRTFRFAGREWPVSGLTPYQLGQFEAYLKDAVPSPLAEFKALVRDGGFSAEERAELFREARERAEPQYDPQGFQVGGWPPTFNSREGQQLLFNGRGLGYFLYVVLGKHAPELTRDEAERLAPHFGVADLRALTELIQVSAPGDDDEVGDQADDDGPDPPGIPPLPPGYVDPKK